MRKTIQRYKYGVLIVALFAMSGVTGAYAQSVFLKPEPKNKTAGSGGEKPRLYVLPEGYDYPEATEEQKKAAQIDSNIKLENRKLQKIVSQKIEIYKEWNAMGFKPKTAEEIRAYADASRARQQAQNYKRKEKLIAKLEKRNLKRQQEIAMKTSAQSQSALQINTSGSSVSKAVDSSKTETAHTTTKPPVKTIYQKPSSFKKPSKVFSDY